MKIYNLNFVQKIVLILLLEETDGDNIIGEDDTTSVGESILLENKNRHRYNHNT